MSTSDTPSLTDGTTASDTDSHFSISPGKGEEVASNTESSSSDMSIISSGESYHGGETSSSEDVGSPDSGTLGDIDE